MIHAELLQSSTGASHAVQTKHHCLTSTALHLSATILLNRIASPDIRTDEESQAAAREIFQIARRLQKLGFSSPRSLMWPIPIFIAGMEVTDEIYQDWVLDYMREMAKRGYSTLNATELLGQIIEKQATEGKRIKVRDAVRDTPGGLHVLV